MSDTSDRENRTEQATPRRLQKAREEGSVVRAHGLAAVAIMICGAFALTVGGSALVDLLERSLLAGLRLDAAAMQDPDRLLVAAKDIVLPGLEIVAPFLCLMAVVGFFADTLVGGWVFSTQPLAPDVSRIDPLKGFARLFSLNGLVEIVKALAKFLVVAVVAFWLIRSRAPTYIGLAAETWPAAARHAAELSTHVFLVLAAALAAVAALEVPYQLWSHRDRLKMTRQELKDEVHQLEGSPQTKRRIKTLRRKLARMRMMSEVPKADAVVVNPQHYAAALRYQEGRMRAPRLLAKGTGLIALRIREVAEEHGVPVIEAPPLARAICRYVELEDEIPVGLYQAVAEVLAYVYRLKAARETRRSPPDLPRDGRFDPPPEYDA
ncbi:MAG TPA: flagellar biosynthesis protein FlhB [Stellaceae bacterium]|nr:flagellar biosynthesis protein FlhB [Stellaceae bacterium]